MVLVNPSKTVFFCVCIPPCALGEVVEALVLANALTRREHPARFYAIGTHYFSLKVRLACRVQGVSTHRPPLFFPTRLMPTSFLPGHLDLLHGVYSEHCAQRGV